MMARADCRLISVSTFSSYFSIIVSSVCRRENYAPFIGKIFVPCRYAARFSVGQAAEAPRQGYAAFAMRSISLLIFSAHVCSTAGSLSPSMANFWQAVFGGIRQTSHSAKMAFCLICVRVIGGRHATRHGGFRFRH